MLGSSYCRHRLPADNVARALRSAHRESAVPVDQQMHRDAMYSFCFLVCNIEKG